MNKKPLLSVLGVLLVTSFVLTISTTSAQFPPSANETSKAVTANGTSVTVDSNILMQVTNATLKAKEDLLRKAVMNFLNSGPNVLNSLPTDQPVVKTKISNIVTNTTQNVEGAEATNAIIGVEVSKALKSIIASSKNANQGGGITIVTTSTCKPAISNVVTCENTISLK